MKRLLALLLVLFMLPAAAEEETDWSIWDVIDMNAQEAEEADEPHEIRIENVEDERFLTVCHPMTKQHYISFIAYITSDRVQLVKLYPEGNAETRIQPRGHGMLYWYCNQHGLFQKRI